MNQLHYRRRQAAEPCDCLRPAVRIFGLITAFVVCGVGVDINMHGYHTGFVIICCSLAVLLFETKWIITLFLQLLYASENYSKCLNCWSFFKIAGGWRLAPPYIAFGTALILWPHNLWLSYVAGLMLILLAVLRLCTLFRFAGNHKDEGLLPHCNFEKVNIYPDVPEDGFAEVCPSLEDEEPIDDVC